MPINEVSTVPEEPEEKPEEKPAAEAGVAPAKTCPQKAGGKGKSKADDYKNVPEPEPVLEEEAPEAPEPEAPEAPEPEEPVKKAQKNHRLMST